MQVFCPCREPKNFSGQSAPTLLDRDECFHDLNRLLFCSQCSAVRCPWCTISEPVMWFCSRCLAESTKTDARKAGNHCTRDCARCPRCHTDIKIRNSAESWHTKCYMCGYSAVFPKTEPTFAKQCRNLQSVEFDQISHWVPHQWTSSNSSPTLIPTPTSSKPINGELVPFLVPLRAKTAKYCRQCNAVLSDPELDVNKPQFSVKQLARSMLPHFEIHNTKIVLRSFSKTTMRIRLALYPAESPISLSQLSLEILPVQPVNNVAKTGFLAPLSLVERETVASRQAFMANQSNNTSGPGWHCIDIEGVTDEKYIYVFASIEVDELTSSIWYRLPTPRGNLSDQQVPNAEAESDSSQQEFNSVQLSNINSSDVRRSEVAAVDSIFKPVFTPATVLRLSESRKNSANDTIDTAEMSLDID